MACKCATVRDRFWQELVDTVSLRHGFTQITWQEMCESLTDKEQVLASVLASFDRTPLRDVYETLASYLVFETPAEEIERIFSDEIFPLDSIVTTRSEV